MIEQGHLERGEFEELLRTLRAVDARLLLHRAAGECVLVTLVVNAGGALGGQAAEVYDYGEVVLASGVLAGGDVADWLSRGVGELAGLAFTVPEPVRNGTREHRESRQRATYGTLFATPHTEYRLSARDRGRPSWPAGVLAGPGLPFYPRVDVAASSVLLDISSLPGGWSIPSEMVLLRIAHTGAYFERVRVSSDSFVASVGGDDVGGVRLQVSWTGGRHEEDLTGPGDVIVPVADAASTDTWVALTRDAECLDFRAISGRWPDPWGQRDIVFEPEDIGERLDLMRLAGEDERVEFKRAVPEGDGIARAVAAFANGDGGTILVGIGDETAEVVGVADPAACRDRLVDIVRNGVAPAPDYELVTCTMRERPVVAMRVEPGEDRPYGVRGTGGLRYYVRRGATNRVAEPEEMRTICQARAGARPSLPAAGE